MAFPTVTNTFTNGSTADATQVNQNFTDIINGISDTTKDISVNNATFAGGGTVTCSGNIVLGASSTKTLTINASLASSIAISANNSWDVGSATLGLSSIYFGSAGGFTTRVKGAATSSWTLTLPVTAGTSLQVLQTDGTGVSSWVTPAREINAKQNIAFANTVATNAMTVALKYVDGSDASATNAISIYFRNATSATGTNILRTVTGALSITISSGATLGHTSGNNEYIYIYAIDNAGTVELAVSGSRMFDEGSILTTGAMSGAATSKTTLYSTISRSNVAVRYLGRLKSNQTVAGTWTSTATEQSLTTDSSLSLRSSIRLSGGNGYGSTNTRIRRYTTAVENIGSAMTYADSATNGMSVTLNEDGLYTVYTSDGISPGNTYLGVSINSNQLTTNIQSITDANILCVTTVATGLGNGTCCSFYGKVGDVIRAHQAGDQTDTAFLVRFSIIKVSS